MTATSQRLFSLSGVLPLGLFLVEHIAVCGMALGGQPAFVHAVARLDSLPLLRVLEVVFIWLPLAVHAGMGVWMIATKRSLPERPYSPRMRGLMRVTGVLALVFLVWHMWAFRVRAAGAGPEELYSRLAEELSATWWFSSASPDWRGVPVVALLYLVGILATVFHFTAGLWAFGAAWKNVRAGWACAALGVVLTLVGANTVLCFATGSRYFAPGSFAPADLDPSTAACPASASATHP